MAERQSTADRQRQIAGAALKIIARDGLGKFTAAAVAEEVGIADGTIFRHFADMEAVVNAAIDHLVGVLNDGVPPAAPDPLSRLETFLKRRFRLITTEPAILRLFFSEQLVQAAGEEGVLKIRRIQQDSLRFIRTCLREARAAGQLRSGLRLEELEIIVQGAVLGELLRFTHADPQAKESAGRRAEQLWKTLVTLIKR